MGKSQRDKGRRYEQHLVRVAHALGFPGAHRTIMSGAAHEAGDIGGLPFHCEAKDCARKSVPGWWRQAVADCPEDTYPVLACKLSRGAPKPAEDLALIRWDDFLDLTSHPLPVRLDTEDFQAHLLAPFSLVDLHGRYQLEMRWELTLAASQGGETPACTFALPDGTELVCLRFADLLRLELLNHGQLPLGVS